MKQGFPWVLAAQYLMAGVGSVFGVLSSALASIAMREIQGSASNSTQQQFILDPSHRKNSIAIELRRHNLQNSHQNQHHMQHSEDISFSTGGMHLEEEEEKATTECTSGGVFETSFP